MQNLGLLVKELIKLPNETPWLEFKQNNYEPEMIGRDISALANSATLHEKASAYMLWGVDDQTHELVGTQNNFQTLKKGNEELEGWLRRMLSKNADFDFYSVDVEEKTIGVLIIHKALNQTVTFEKTEYIRIGSYTKKLNEHPSVQGQLWDRIRNSRFEEGLAKQDLELDKALQLLEFQVYFENKNIPLPSDAQGVAHYMLEEGILIKQDNGLYSITNLGAILFAKKLADFPKLARKAIRLVSYKGNNRLEMLKEFLGLKGYALEFQSIINFIEALIPTQEVIIGALREKKTGYPLISIRESIANALIHQDFSITGAGPVIEIFENRLEITNPGIPLVDVKRIIDNPPRSRNEKLATLMRYLRMCEELGTGWDKIVISCELMQLPAPKIELFEGSTKVTLFSKVPFTNLSSEEKVWACYLHASIRHVQGEQLTNCSLRERFGLPVSSSGSVSRLIKEAVELRLIKPIDPNTAPRYMKYVPVWA